MMVTTSERRRIAPASGTDPHIGQAPGRLAIVQAFVNTLDIEQATDELSSPAGLDRWLAAHDLLPAAPAAQGPARRAPARDGGPGSRSGAADLALAVELRETLRAVLRSHVRPPRDPSGPPEASAADPGSATAPARLADIAAGLPAAITAGADGSVRLVAASAGSSGALTTLLLIAAEAETLGTWARLKVCSADDCEWAFYDRSPTRNGCWCSMQICGSRAKSRAYRRRATGQTPSRPDPGRVPR
jgi:predicted RNA-binding Zn ribbon-like protein